MIGFWMALPNQLLPISLSLPFLHGHKLMLFFYFFVSPLVETNRMCDVRHLFVYFCMLEGGNSCKTSIGEVSWVVGAGDGWWWHCI
jgi:hypothetical protein